MRIDLRVKHDVETRRLGLIGQKVCPDKGC